MGYQGKAKAKEGGWIVICSHESNGDIKEVYRAKVGHHKILGKKIQPDAFYWIENGELKSSL